jgi:hypothetical protein
VAAILYTLVETAKLHRVDPTKYLTEAVRAADRGDVLFPWRCPSRSRGALLSALAGITTGRGEI